MSDFFARVGEYAARLMSGGTFEIILLIVLIIVALILFLIALWILWKLLVLLGKGALWLLRNGIDAARAQSRTKREARLAAPPMVATGWGAARGIGLRRALSEARGMAGPNAMCVVVVAGDGMSGLCRSLGLTPPGVGTIGIAAGGDLVLIDASRASGRMLRSLASALPWRRPVDAGAVLLTPEGVPGDALARSASFARATGMRVCAASGACEQRHRTGVADHRLAQSRR